MQNLFTRSLALRSNSHLTQSLDALLKRGMRAEERGPSAAAEERFYDAQGRGRRGKRGRRNALVIGPQFLERTHQTVGLAHHPCPRFICRKLSLARKTQLQQHCGERCKKK